MEGGVLVKVAFLHTWQPFRYSKDALDYSFDNTVVACSDGGMFRMIRSPPILFANRCRNNTQPKSIRL